MALTRYNIEVKRIDEYEIQIDDSFWTPEEIKNWSDIFHDATKPKHIANHLAKAISNKGIKEYMEGFGHVKQKHRLMKDGQIYPQLTSKMQEVDEEDYAEGILVTIIQHNEGYETETMKLKSK
jgi:hemerythrin superfamily protein